MEAQPINDTLKRYNKAVQFISDNSIQVKKQWISTIPGYKKRKNKKEVLERYSFRFSPVICFLPILIFSDEIEKIDTVVQHSLQEITEPSIYWGRHGFKSFVSEYLLHNGLSDTGQVTSNQMLIVNFSKPINNYLIAEVSTAPGKLKQCDVRLLGRTLWILFTFSKDETINKVYYSYLDR